MNIKVDLHTHTISSGHAYSTITENMKEAAEKNMLMVAMTDHAPNVPGGPPIFHIKNTRILPNEMFGVKLLKGVEANIIDYNGTVDVADDILEGLDMAIVSLHSPCIPYADKETVTAGIEKVMENPYINIIGHPGDSRYPLDFERIVKKSKETGTFLEVNNASLRTTSPRPGVRENLITMLNYCKQYEVPVVLGSDAHFHEDIGEFQETIALLEELSFPEELIMNLYPEKLIAAFKEKRLK